MPSEKDIEYIVVDRRTRSYAFFIDSEQQGNWMGYVDDNEPYRIASELDLTITVKGLNHHA